MPLSQIVSASIEDGAVAPVDLSSVAQYYGFKNRFINAEMKIAQRGTSFSSPATATYTLDRWQIGVVGTPPASVAQVAGPAGFKNAIQFTGAVGNTATQLLQKIESFNCSDLSGQTITIQANISVSSSQTIAWFLFSAASADNWTSPNLLTSGTWSATSTPTTFTATITNLASSVTNGLALYICANNNGPFTSGTFTVTGVQLEKGVTATSFDYRPYGTELALCQRYLPAYSYNSSGTAGYEQIGSGYWTSSTSTYIFVPHPVNTRVPPTGLVSDGASNFLNLYTTNLQTTGLIWTATAGVRGSLIAATATGGAAGGGVILITKNTGGLLYFTGCEL